MSEIRCVYSPYFLLKSYNVKTKSVKPKTHNLSKNYEFKLNKKINGITIDSKTGVISFDNCIEIGKYKILIKLIDKESKRKIYLKYFLVVLDDVNIFKSTEENNNSVTNNNKFYYNPYFLLKTKNQQINSSIPIIKIKDKVKYEFKFEKSERGVFINPNNGQITFDDTINVGRYFFNILLINKNNSEIINNTQYYLIVIDDDSFKENKNIKNNDETELLSTDYYNIDVHNSGELSSKEFDCRKLKLTGINDDIKLKNHIEIVNSCIADKIINGVGKIVYNDKLSFVMKKIFNYFNMSSNKYNSDDLTIFILSIVLIGICKKKFF